MNRISTIAFLIAVFIVSCGGPSKNVVEKTAHVYGNCEKCKKVIESAAKIKGVEEAVWDVNSKLLTYKLDTILTSSSIILKSVAAAGYDNEEFIGNDYAYQKLPECCHYERKE
jgi:mercuric ion binding protein